MPLTVFLAGLDELIPAVHHVPRHVRVGAVADHALRRDDEEDLAELLVRAPFLFPRPIQERETNPSWPSSAFEYPLAAQGADKWGKKLANGLCLKHGNNRVGQSGGLRLLYEFVELIPFVCSIKQERCAGEEPWRQQGWRNKVHLGPTLYVNSMMLQAFRKGSIRVHRPEILDDHLPSRATP